MSTTISIVNATSTTIQVVNSVSPSLDGEYWQNLASSVPNTPGATNVLEFNRNEGIKNGKTWTFSTNFKIDGIEVSLQEKVTGTFAASDMTQSMTAGTASTGFVDTNDSRSISFTGKSGAKYSLTWELSLSTSLYMNIQYAVKVTKPVYVPVTPVMPQIETVVFLMLENRSLDNVLGMLYSKDAPSSVYPKDSAAAFDGVPLTAKNYYHDKAYSPSDGCDSMSAPRYDPHEEFAHIQNQLYADGTGALPSGNLWSNTPPMTGFAWDFDEIWTTNQEVMGSYNKAQLPVLYGLAENYAVSDRWFCSIPTQTYANRAYSLCGTSLGKVDNSEIDGNTYANSDTIFNVLGNTGKSWGVYWVDDGGIAAGSPLGKPFTPYYFPRLNAAPNGGVYEFNKSGDSQAFMQALAAGTLPNFCFVEPTWGGGFGPTIQIQGTDFHPPTDVGPCEKALNSLFEALAASPQWNNMLLIITFDEHGGTYDHVPPATTVAPDNAPLAPSTSEHGFAFQRLGVRVPTLLVSRYVPKGVVFRSPKPGVEFDHTSFLATLCKWTGVDPASAGLGARVAQAPTFDEVLSSTPRTDKPVLSPAPPTAEAAAITNPLALPAPTDSNGKPLTAQPIHFGDLHAVADASTSPEEFVERLQALRYPRPE